MALFTASLNSGSNGNCYYVGNEHEAILVDAGISCREIEKRMKNLGLPIQQLKAVFISHEHSDHICGIEALAKKYRLPVYVTPKTLISSGLSIEEQLLGHFLAYEPVQIGALSVTAFPKQHDAADPHSFIISHQGITVGVFTDIGGSCDHVSKHFRQCHAAFLEANYDEALLEKGRYPYHLKRRIRGGKGHLSNTQALEIFTTYRPAFMSHLFLSHLSKDNNCPKLAQELFSKHASMTEVIVASRHQETAVYRINSPNDDPRPPEAVVRSVEQVQFTLF